MFRLMSRHRVSYRRLPWRSLVACCLAWAAMPAAAQDHAHHQMTDEQFTELREKVPLYREYTNEQIMDSMARMGPNFHVYLSDDSVHGKIGILALGHGYTDSGNEAFEQAYASTARKYPTAVGLGMAMMTSDHIQSAIDELAAAGAKTVVVMPVTTLKVGGLIDQWRYIFNLKEDAPWMSVDRVNSDVRVIFGPTPTTDPVIDEILVDYANEMSRDPANEVVALIAHGPDEAEQNKYELGVLEQHAAAIRAVTPFAQVRGFTLQDDAPPAIRDANVRRIREWVQTALDRGQRVLVLTTLPVKGSVHAKIRRDLNGLDYVLNEKGIVEHPKFANWIDSVIASADDS